jgi:hypothetical protein
MQILGIAADLLPIRLPSPVAVCTEHFLGVLTDKWTPQGLKDGRDEGTTEQAHKAINNCRLDLSETL